MFKIIADHTNTNARNRISSIMHGRYPKQQLGDPTNKKHNRLHSCKDINATDIKLFMAHVIVMSLVQKSAVHGYWSKKTLSHTHTHTHHFLASTYHIISFKQYYVT